jgi:hypothetical protein
MSLLMIALEMEENVEGLEQLSVLFSLMTYSCILWSLYSI